MTNAPDQPEQDTKVIQDAVTRLTEHFDTVHIFATRHDPITNNTVSANFGVGSWFSRAGQIKEWVIKSDERSRMECHED